MARFDKLNLELDSQKAKFGNDSAHIYHDDNLIISGGNTTTFNNQISGISSGCGLITKRDVDLRFLSGCHVYASSSQTLSSYEVVDFDTVIYDPLNEYDGTNAFRPKESGVYLVSVGIHCVSLLNGESFTLRILCNSSVYGVHMFTMGDASNASNHTCCPVKVNVAGFKIQAETYVSADTYGSDTMGRYVYMVVQRIL